MKRTGKLNLVGAGHVPHWLFKQGFYFSELTRWPENDNLLPDLNFIGLTGSKVATHQHNLKISVDGVSSQVIERLTMLQQLEHVVSFCSLQTKAMGSSFMDHSFETTSAIQVDGACLFRPTDPLPALWADECSALSVLFGIVFSSTFDLV